MRNGTGGYCQFRIFVQSRENSHPRFAPSQHPSSRPEHPAPNLRLAKCVCSKETKTDRRSSQKGRPCQSVCKTDRRRTRVLHYYEISVCYQMHYYLHPPPGRRFRRNWVEPHFPKLGADPPGRCGPNGQKKS
jgi:hypothetical protein